MSAMRPRQRLTPAHLAEIRDPHAPWRFIPPTGPPDPFAPPPPEEMVLPTWFKAVTFPLWFWWPILQSFGHIAPRSVDMRMNDPLWVLYDPQTGRVDRGEDRYRNGRPYNSRGTDSDGSGMM